MHFTRWELLALCVVITLAAVAIGWAAVELFGNDDDGDDAMKRSDRW